MFALCVIDVVVVFLFPLLLDDCGAVAHYPARLLDDDVLRARKRSSLPGM